MEETYEEMKEALVEINMKRQSILETRKQLNKNMRFLEKRAKELNDKIIKKSNKYNLTLLYYIL